MSKPKAKVEAQNATPAVDEKSMTLEEIAASIPATVRNSTVERHGKTYLFSHTVPSGTDMIERLGLPRLMRFAVDYVNRHNILKEGRDAIDTLENGSSAKSDEGKKKDVARATALMAKVEAGDTLDFWAYVPDQKIPPSRWEKFAAEVGKLARLAANGDPMAAKKRAEMMSTLTDADKAAYGNWCMFGTEKVEAKAPATE